MNASGFTRDVVTVLSKEAIPSQDQMKAAYYLMHGNETVIEVNDRVSRPIVRDRQLLIKVTATALNPVDIKLREHNVPQLVLPLPKIIGSDLSGTVVEKGPLASEKFKVGDKVIAMMPHVGSGWGSACEFAAVEEDHLAPAPSNVSPVEAASLPLISLTVVQSIKPFVDACGGQTSGKSVLVQAGSGGLGSFAVQYCKKELGMKVYTSCSGENANFVRSLGADVVIDYKTQKFEEVAEGMDLVFDPMAYMYEERTFKSKVLKSTSFYVHIASSSNAMSNSNLDPLRIAIPEAAPHRIAAGYSCAVGRKLLSWMGFGAAQYVYHFVKPDGASLSKVSRMVEEGKIKPIVEADSVFPLEQMAAAQMKVRDGHVRGKVVVRVTQD